MIRALEKCVLIHTEHEMGDVNNLLLILLTILNFCWNYLIFKLFHCINIHLCSFYCLFSLDESLKNPDEFGYHSLSTVI